MSNEMVRRPRVTVAELGPGRVALTGPMREIDYALRLARRAGTVVGDASTPVRTEVPGQWMVTARRAPVVRRAAAPTGSLRAPWRWIAIGGGVGLVALAALCGGAVLAGMWLVAHALEIASLVVAIAAVLWMVNRATGGSVVEVFVRVRS